MRRFVADNFGARGQVVCRRVCRKQDSIFAQEGRARVLHSAVSEFWNEHDVVLRKRIFEIEVTCEEVEAITMQTKYFRPFFACLFDLRFANEEVQSRCAILDRLTEVFSRFQRGISSSTSV